MNFSAISRDSIPGKLLRLPLRLLPPGMVMPIMQGPMKGMRWVVGSGDHGYWLGSYELAFQNLFAGTVQTGDVVFDIGAHVGYYTMLAARRVGPNGHVYAFEPLPRNAAFLTRHILINDLDNVTLRQLAISDQVGSVHFGGGISSSTGRITQDGELEVDAAALDNLLESENITPPSVLKIDVEGAEAAVLKGGEKLLRHHQPVIFLATHGSEVREECRSVLSSLNYSLQPINAERGPDASEFFASPA
jgi:FkbM family methyltransferase